MPTRTNFLTRVPAMLTMAAALLLALPADTTRAQRKGKSGPSRAEISKHIAGEKPVRPGGVNRLRCVNLYEHQLKIAAGDKLNSLSPAMRMHLRLMQSTNTRKAQLNYCLKTVSRANYDCQMKAESLLDILQCRRRHPLTGANAKKTPTADPGRKDPPKNTRREEPPKVPATSLKVNAAGCSGAYEHLLRVYSRSDLLSNRPDAARLLRHWNSPAARRSFANRCLREFQSRDLRCIRTAVDPVVIQGCLTRIGR